MEEQSYSLEYFVLLLCKTADIIFVNLVFVPTSTLCSKFVFRNRFWQVIVNAFPAKCE